MDPAHRLRTTASSAARREAAAFWLFRAATYLVVGCGAAVFLTIFLRGAGTVLQKEPPFINTAFFTEAPETLYVFDFEGAHRQMGFREYQVFKAAHPNLSLIHI